MLAWILNLDFAAGGLGVGQGPYRLVVGRAAHTGAAAAATFVAGTSVGQFFQSGAQAGQIHA